MPRTELGMKIYSCFKLITCCNGCLSYIASFIVLIILTVQRFDQAGRRCSLTPSALEEQYGYSSDDYYYDDSVFIKRAVITMWVFLLIYFCSCCIIAG